MATDQPPEQASYYQSNNPVTHNPQEHQQSQRHRGDPVPVISHRDANSKPADDERQQGRQRGKQDAEDAANVDLEYGVEQQPSEGSIAEAVEHKGTRARTQAGAHAGPVGSAHGPGYSGFGEEDNEAADLGRKREEHDQVLGDRVGQSPPEPEGEAAEMELVSQQKMKLDDQLDVKDVVHDATGDPVAGR